jgi:hypothetical protein
MVSHSGSFHFISSSGHEAGALNRVFRPKDCIRLILREEHIEGVRGEYLDLRGRMCWEAAEDCIMRSFITCTLHQMLLG